MRISKKVCGVKYFTFFYVTYFIVSIREQLMSTSVHSVPEELCTVHGNFIALPYPLS